MFSATLVGGCEVVRDVDDGDAKLAVELPDAVEDGGANRGIHHGYGFVRQDDTRLQHERPGHHGPLSLAAAELMGESSKSLIRPQANRFERSFD